MADDLAIQEADHYASAGVPGIKKWIQGLRGFDSEKQIKAIHVVADADTDPAARLLEIRTALIDVNTDADAPNRYSVPNAVGQRATENEIAVTITLVPGGGASGCLETVLVEVLREQYQPQMTLIDELADAIQIPNRPQNMKDKSLMGLAIPCLIEDDPLCSLPRLFREHPEVIPLAHDRLKFLFDALNAT